MIFADNMQNNICELDIKIASQGEQLWTQGIKQFLYKFIGRTCPGILL